MKKVSVMSLISGIVIFLFFSYAYSADVNIQPQGVTKPTTKQSSTSQSVQQGKTPSGDTMFRIDSKILEKIKATNSQNQVDPTDPCKIKEAAENYLRIHQANLQARGNYISSVQSNCSNRDYTLNDCRGTETVEQCQTRLACECSEPARATFLASYRELLRRIRILNEAVLCQENNANHLYDVYGPFSICNRYVSH